MPFPAAKLLSVALRQLSRPVAAWLQRAAADSPRFKLACVAAANCCCSFEQQVLHSFYRRAFAPKFLPRLSEDKAVRLGASLIGEAFVFAVAATALAVEYRRSALKEAAKENQLQSRLMTLEAQVLQLQQENDRMLKSIFPDDKYVRSAIDINYQEEGWFSWLAKRFSAAAAAAETEEESKQ